MGLSEFCHVSNLSAVGFSGEMVLLVDLGILKEASKIPTLPFGDALRLGDFYSPIQCDRSLSSH